MSQRAKRATGSYKPSGAVVSWVVKDAPVKDFRDLHVYQSAFARAMEVFELSKKWPVEERSSMTDQIRRATRAVCSNIAEAWRKRRYPAAFMSKLSDADAEAGETLVWLQFALSCGYLSKERHVILSDAYDHICAQLTIMMGQPSLWRSS